MGAAGPISYYDLRTDNNTDNIQKLGVGMWNTKKDTRLYKSMTHCKVHSPIHPENEYIFF